MSTIVPTMYYNGRSKDSRSMRLSINRRYLTVEVHRTTPNPVTDQVSFIGWHSVRQIQFKQNRIKIIPIERYPKIKAYFDSKVLKFLRKSCKTLGYLKPAKRSWLPGCRVYRPTVMKRKDSSSLVSSLDRRSSMISNRSVMKLTMSSKDFHSVPPPKNLNARQLYTRTDDIHYDINSYCTSSSSSSSKRLNNFGRKSRYTDLEDDYFEHDDDDDIVNSNFDAKKSSANDNDDEEEEEEDPLDLFMAELNKSEGSGSKNSIKKAKSNEKSQNSNKSNEKSSSSKGVRQDIEDEDLEESYYKYMESNPNAGIGTMPDDSEEIEYDDDGNPIGMVKKMIDPLPMIYHSEIEYLPFEKNFYTQHEDITKLTTSECVELRHKLGIKVSGANPPKPCSSFAHFGFDEKLMKVVRKYQPELKYGEGPIGLILVPTRELSQQIYQEAKKFAKPFGIHVLCAYGGGSKYDQSKDLEQGADIIVATPKRIEKLIRDVLNDPIRIIQGDLGEANQDITQIVKVFKAEKDTEKLGHLIRNLESANQDVPEELMKLAMNSQWFRNSRFKSNPAKSITKYGLGFSESKRRTGFGYQSSSSTTTTTTSSSNETSEGVHERNSDKTSGKDKPSNETNRNENRMSIMRSNFKAQFQSRFTAATDTAWKKNENEPQNKKSRWN
ncbi:twitchin-like [Sarcoptes scabiei]|nr:twitchin-like [Sarcoptes scabiei]